MTHDIQQVTLAAGDPLVGGICVHVQDLADYICRLWSPTGLVLDPEVLQEFLDQNDFPE